ncbi:hypothetical protein Alsa1_CDS0176 [Staphylococcus phage Alsa_1]|nr:hypothetical protein Alsa1_CDS0176 [Staphylococcus phage Alsa_1]
MGNIEIKINDLEKQVKKAYYERVHALGFAKLMEQENSDSSGTDSGTLEKEINVITNLMETFAQNRGLTFETYLEKIVRGEI